MADNCITSKGVHFLNYYDFLFLFLVGPEGLNKKTSKMGLNAIRKVRLKELSIDISSLKSFRTINTVLAEKLLPVSAYI
jgi:hypothetical protein